MKTGRDRILDYLSEHPNGVDDDELARALDLRYRQQANAVCRQLASEGRIARMRVGGKIRNFRKGGARSSKSLTQREPTREATDEPWYWEGNVQRLVAKFLEAEGYSIVRMADTKARESGKDIEAKSGSRSLWVTVKGYPKGTPRTSPSTQAGHWFKHGLFDIVSWRGENPLVELFMALPDFPRYRKLSARVAWLRPIARFSFVWAKEDGSVMVE